MAIHEPPVPTVSASCADVVTAPAFTRRSATPAEALRPLLPEAALADDRFGPLEDWSPALVTAASICLTSRFPILLWWGPQLRLLYNDDYRPMLGSKHPHSFGAPGREVWSEIWDTIGPMLDQVRTGGGATWSTDEMLVLDRNGFPEECFFTFSYSPVLDEAGSVEGVFSVVSETTERVLGERRLGTLAAMARLAGSESRTDVLSRATTALHDNVGDHPVAQVLDIPPQAASCELRAVLADRLPHLSVRSRARIADVVRQVASTDRPSSVTAEPDPAVPLVSTWHAYPVPEPVADDAAVRAVLLLGQSVRRPWDDSLHSYAVQCTAHVAAALTGVAHLLAERRRAAALTALHEAKSEFFTNVSHELRTPLTLITGPVEDALAQETCPYQRTRLELVSRQARHLTRLVDELLDLGRIEAGRMEPDPAPVDLAALTRTLCESFRPSVERAGLALTVDCRDIATPCRVDAAMYERILLNLLSNALKYTPHGSVDVHLAPDGDHVELTVRDTGVGIDTPDLDRVFERFERLPEQQGARARAGAGVGLAMVRQLSRLMGGSVRVRSRLGEGSAFTVRLPVAGADVAVARSGVPSVTPRDAGSVLRDVDGWLPTAPPSPHDEAPGPDAVVPARGDAGRPLLLVVEDHSDLRRYLADVLGEDYEVEVAADGLAAMRAVRRRAPDLVVTDVMMPGMDGHALVRDLRADPHLSGIPVLILSARSGAGATSEGLLAGADDYLSKPFSVVELRARVASNLERAGARMRDGSWRRAMIGSFHEALVITDLEGVLLDANQEFGRVVGWTPASGTARQDLGVTGAGAPCAAEHATVSHLLTTIGRLATTRGAAEEHDLRLERPDGTLAWVSLRVSVVDGGRLQPSFVVATLRDTTVEHLARERRVAAACVAAELSTAEDLTDVVATAVSGFGELFGGEVLVQVVVNGERRTFTASGPDGVVVDEVDGSAQAPPSADGSVPGIRFGDGELGGTGHEVCVQFARACTTGPDERVVGELLFRAFTLACERVVAVSELADREQHLRRAIESHEAIGQAVGILVERHRCTPAAAFAMLKKTSQDHNVKLRAVADQVVVSGADPGPADGPSPFPTGPQG